MDDSGIALAIVGAATELGRDLREVLIERAFPAVMVRLFDEAAAIVEQADSDELEPIESLEDAILEDCDIVFVCRASALDAVEAEAAAGDYVTIDLSLESAAGRDVVLIVPEVNAEMVATAVEERHFLATPLPAVTALSVALAPLDEMARLRRVALTCLEPVSSVDGGAAELARQTGELLSGRTPEPLLWSERIAFNVIPQVGDLSATGASEREWQIQKQVRAVLDLPDLPISTHVVRVPTFYGYALTVDVEMDEPIDLESVLDRWRQAPGIYLHTGEGEEPRYATLSQTVGSEATHLGRVREDPTVPCGLNFWLTIDGLRKGTTVNAVQIAECVLRELQPYS